MTSKSLKHKNIQSCSEHKYQKVHIPFVYGMPSKPRYLQPSMYQILSWNQENQPNQQNHQMLIHDHQIHQQPTSIKRIIHCKSLPAEKFHKNKQQVCHLDNQKHQFTNKPIQKSQNQKRVKLSDLEDNIEPHQLTKNQSFKKLTASTKLIDSDKQKNTKNLKKGEVQNLKSTKNIQPNQKKTVKQQKLIKKSIHHYSDPDKKPRYMEIKKRAVQKLIESEDFDKQEFQKMKEQQIKKFKQTSRDLSNTAFLTYFNRPPFQNYGRQNKNTGGVLYGDYMYSHNVFPHTGQNNPKNQQSYISALTRAKSAGNIRPHPPLSRNLEQKLISGYLTLTQIYPKNNTIPSIPIKNETNLQNLPQFNLSSDQYNNKHKYSPYIKADQNQNIFMDNIYLDKQQIPRFFSNKDQIQGKQISYTKKIQPSRKIQ